MREEEDEYECMYYVIQCMVTSMTMMISKVHLLTYSEQARRRGTYLISYKSSHGCFDLMAPMAWKFCCKRQHDLTTLVPCCPNLLGHTHLLIIPSNTSTIFSSEDSHPALLAPLLVRQESDLAASTLGF